MSKNNKLDENQLWMMILIILPVTMLIPLSSVIADDGSNKILYAGVLGLAGGMLGALGVYITKDRSRTFKILTALFLVLICSLAIYLLKPSETEVVKEVAYDEWITQQIGHIEFDTPTKLTLQSLAIPESARGFYSALNVYTDEGSDRIISFVESEILIDSLDVEDAFNHSLETMVSMINGDLEKFELEILEADFEEVSAIFSFELNKQRASGYGFMFLSEKSLESVWLMPLSKGFSKEFIEEFDAGVFPIYD